MKKKGPPKLSDKDKVRIRALLRHFNSLNYSLQDCADPRRLKIEPRQLLELAREAGTVFRDEVEFSRRASKPKDAP